MQYVNDDMDDVFRKAAENYPLDTSGSDWNKVLTAMQGPESPTVPEKKNDYRRFLWLLMLLPLGLVCNYYYQKGSLRQNDGSISKNKDQTTAPSGSLKKAIGPETTQKTGETGETNPEVVSNTVQPIRPASGSEHQQMSATPLQLNKKGKHGLKAFGSNTDSYATNTNTSNADEIAGAGLPAGVAVNTKHLAGYASYVDQDKNKPGPANIHPEASFTGLSFHPANKQNAGKNPRRFYVGLMGGLDKTTIEFQEPSKHGVDYGALLGYKIGRRWSVEAAAFMDKKYYYTEGKYFKYDGITLPPTIWITDVNGSCRMWDISFGGTYTISQGRKFGWFAAAGVSSYFMKEESYDYTYYYATSGTSSVHSKTYMNASKDPFSIVNLSMGYTHRMLKNTDLRVEPYVKIPVQGVGVGNLSLFSAGLHIGVTSKLF